MISCLTQAVCVGIPQQFLYVRLRILAAHRVRAPAPRLCKLQQGLRGDRRLARHTEGRLGANTNGMSQHNVKSMLSPVHRGRARSW